MNDTEQKINQWFASHMEQTAQAASHVAPAIEQVADAFVNTLLQDGKIVACANGNANVVAQYFCTALLSRFDQERPALPAINLGDRKSTRLNSSHVRISYAVFCLKKKKHDHSRPRYNQP